MTRFPSILLSVLLLAGCARREIEVSPPPPDNGYTARLVAVKQQYPFARWYANGASMEQYSKANCDAVVRVFDRLINRLANLGADASEPAKLAAFREAIETLNGMNSVPPRNLIETEEADELCELCNQIALAAGLDPKKYGHGEGPASEWRDW